MKKQLENRFYKFSSVYSDIMMFSSSVIHAIFKTQPMKESPIIFLGGGITERNLERILQESGAKEFHCSARHSIPSLMEYKNTNTSMGGSLSPPEFITKVASYEKVKNLVFVARSVLP